MDTCLDRNKGEALWPILISECDKREADCLTLIAPPEVGGCDTDRLPLMSGGGAISNSYMHLRKVIAGCLSVLRSLTSGGAISEMQIAFPLLRSKQVSAGGAVSCS